MIGDGDSSARALFRSAFAEHGDYVHALLVRMSGPSGDADDLLQEVFLVAWRRWDDWDSSLPVRAWLTGIAAKVASTARRRSRWRRLVGLQAAAELPARGTPATDFESAEAARAVYAALDGLAEKKRTAFILYEIQGLSGEEIARIAGCPLKTVWTRLFHARREFAAALAKTRSAPEAAAEVRR